jgi:hypothetical protein
VFVTALCNCRSQRRRLLSVQRLHVAAAQKAVLREVYDINESSYRIMGDNLGGGKQVNH